MKELQPAGGKRNFNFDLFPCCASQFIDIFYNYQYCVLKVISIEVYGNEILNFQWPKASVFVAFRGNKHLYNIKY